MTEVLLIICIIFNFYFLISFKKEQKRVRVLTVFIDGLMTYASKIPNMIYEIKDNKDEKFDLKIQTDGHKIIYKDIEELFLNGVSFEAIKSFVKNDKDLFLYNDCINGFSEIYSKVFKNVENEILKKEKKMKIK